MLFSALLYIEMHSLSLFERGTKEKYIEPKDPAQRGGYAREDLMKAVTLSHKLAT